MVSAAVPQSVLILCVSGTFDVLRVAVWVAIVNHDYWQFSNDATG